MGAPGVVHSHQGRLLAGEPLAANNTHAIRVVVDFNALYAETAQPYSTCFVAGGWYRRGFPESSTPPSNGVPTCPRDESEWQVSSREGCWGVCLPSDVLTPGGRDVIEFVITTIHRGNDCERG
jgi:hypothetical protein